MRKYAKHLERALFVVGFSLLAFYATAKIHQIILSRVAIQQFADLDHPSLAAAPSAPPLVSPKTSFVSWSEDRIRNYEDSLSQHLTPPLAILRIARIHVEAPVLEGTDDVTLNRGVGHIEGTARPGEKGNVGIAGHRDGFFRGLKNIKLGDLVELEKPDHTEIYVIDRLSIVDPHDVGVLRSNSQPALTLVTCYPFYYIGNAPLRFIVHATLVSSETAANNVPKNYSPGTF